MPIQVKLIDLSSNAETVREFTQSPVRVGRNQLNDIPIADPFVSEWHGAIRWDATGIQYSDMGSTNGSVLNGQKMQKNTPATLGPGDELFLGRIRVIVSRTSTPSLPPPAPPDMPAGGGSNTIAWGVGDPNRKSGARSSAAVAVRAPTPAPSWTPSGGTAPARPAGATPPGGVAGTGAHRTASQSGTGGPAASDPRAFRVLSTFADAFVGLRKGYEAFGKEVGIRPIIGNTPLHRAPTGREVMDYLLDPAGNFDERLRELTGMFADFGIHHVAVMEGVTEATRSLLLGLDPRANDIESGPGLFGSRTTWKKYLDRFAALTRDDTALSAEVFGEEFAHAYARVARGDGDDGSGDEG